MMKFEHDEYGIRAIGEPEAGYILFGMLLHKTPVIIYCREQDRQDVMEAIRIGGVLYRDGLVLLTPGGLTFGTLTK